MRRAFTTLVMVSTLGFAAEAQTAGRQEASAGSELQVWLITFGEGELYWEKYGHNALWFRDSTRGIDAAYNWGMFDFQSPGFLKRLLLGDMQYWVEAFPGNALIEAYRQRDRSVVIQRLNLTAAQADKALMLSQTNALEANKFYRYDYFRDNCSTRVRDMIDAALGGALRTATADTRAQRTYRSETLRLVDDLKLTQLGIDVALGRPADRELTVWENAFVPSRLRDAVRDVQVRPDPASPPVRLVAEERTLHESRTHVERETTPTLWPAHLAIGVLLAAMFVAVSKMGRTSGALDRVFRTTAGVWSLITGGLGLIVLLAWLITEHVYWYDNRNLFLVNPLSLFVAALAPLSIWRPRFTRSAAILAATIALSCGVAIIVFAIPSFRQDNAPLIFLLVPAHFAVASGLMARAQTTR